MRTGVGSDGWIDFGGSRVAEEELGRERDGS